MAQTLSDMATDFLDYDEDSILLQIGQRASLVEQFPVATALPSSQLQVDYPHLGIGDDLKQLGLRIAKRVFGQLHAVLCGKGDDDKEDREKLKAAFGLSDTAIAAAVAAFLAGPLGIAGAIAGALGALFVKRLLAPTLDETCQFWSEKLHAK